MRISPKSTPVVLVVLTAACIVALYLTRGSAGEKRGGAVNAPVAGVDQQPLDTAQQLAALASSPNEQRLAADAVRLADHEVDLAFSSALRAASNYPAAQTPAVREAQERIDRSQADIAAGNDRINRLKAESVTAKGDRLADVQQQIEVAQAEVSLHQDELGDAQQDLIRAGGDERSKIQALLDQHNTAEHAMGSARATGAASSAAAGGNIVAEVYAWNALRSKEDQIAQAREAALALAAALSQQHTALDHQVDREKQPGGDGAQPAGGGASSDASRSGAAASLKSLHRLSGHERTLAEFDQRIQDLQQLASTYAEWRQLAAADTRMASHRLVKGILWILLAILVAFLIQRLSDRSLEQLKLERTQQATLRSLLHFAVQTLAVLVIVLVIFGTPSQFSTILGLAGAGLTVALKDFIVAFLGWFVLMGRNGIRVGDWVEINGVLGEVVEIGILRTVLLETGNWTGAGFLTGRQVAFLNGYAVEGHYFNFTTSGQWLWDELQVAISGGGDPYPLIERIRAAVEKETEGYAQAAEKDWQRVTSRYGVRPLPLAPTLDLRPSGDGVLVIARYMTRASDRSEVRSRLNHAIVELLHVRQEDMPAAEVLPSSRP